ncbi:MAG: hypothetical protein O3C28_07120 [Proteobacteria bacterium]|nr:hypothetical protein [Pseudomonadota bacterium]
MADRLQKFDYRTSPYERPDKTWVCGRAADGRACQVGPDKRGHCRATAECVPMREGDRWRCKRSAFYGGACERGPNPDGSCCEKIPPCHPIRSWRARRGMFVRWAVALTVGCLLIIFSLPDRAKFLSPGTLSQGHAALEQCETCHASADGGIGEWISALVGSYDHSADSAQCSGCHNFGSNALAAHSLDPEILKSMTAKAESASNGPVAITVAAALLSADEKHGAGLNCTNCHREHKGAEQNIAAFSDQMCVVCHEVKFKSFSDGHPPFTSYPNDRRTHLFFNHVSHIDKHFLEDENKDLAPHACNDCHRTQAGGGRMVLKPYVETCSGCHNSQVSGDGRASAKGIALLGLPGIDVATLVEKGISIGQWPEYAEDDLSAFMNLMLHANPDYAAVQHALADVDMLDLEDASDETLERVNELAWIVKDFFYELESRGASVVSERLAESVGVAEDSSDQLELLAALPPDMVSAARVDWFPLLLEEVQRHRAGLPNATVAIAPAPTPKKSSPDDDADDEDFDSVFGDDSEESTAEDFDAMFGDESGDVEIAIDDPEPESDSGASTPASSEAFSFSDPRIAVEDRASAGGWYREEYQLRYRPAGHEDKFIQSWIETSAESNNDSMQKLFAELTKDGAPGSCMKCHSLDDVDGKKTVNWKVREADPNNKHFNTFSHQAHFNLLDQDGCLACHAFDKESDYASSFDNNNDPHKFASNFKSLSAETCAQCHQEGKAGESCVSCHNYHVGEFKPVLPQQRTLSTGSPAPE